MTDNTKIEWTDATWNPVRARNRETGKIGWYCVHASDGCAHCYAETLNRRFGTRIDYRAQDRDRIEVFLDEAMLTQPLRWRRPRRIFPGSMTDLFGEWVTDEMLDRIFAVMALCPQHTFQVLTKRAVRMQDYIVRQEAPSCSAWLRFSERITTRFGSPVPWPLPNVWAGVSVEDQRRADERIPLLLNTPAAVRFLSVEPALGPIDLERVRCVIDGEERPLLRTNCLTGVHHCGPAVLDEQSAHIDWIIVGGESGPGARPMHPDWSRSIRDQCAAAGVAFFMKQMASKAPIPPDLLARQWPAG